MLAGVYDAAAGKLEEDELAPRGRLEGHAQAMQRQGDINDKDNGKPTMTRKGGRDDGEIQITAGQRMLSALSGSLLTALLVTPLDVVRVRLQSQSSPSSTSKAPPVSGSAPARSFTNLPSNLGVTACCREVFWVNNNAQFCMATPQLSAVTNSPTNLSAAAASECAAEETQRKTFTSTLDGLRKIAKYEGLTSLWRGLSPTLVMSVPGNVIYFTGYDWLRTGQHSPMKDLIPDAYAPLAAGAIARAAAATVVSPIEMFRTRLQASSSSSASGIFKDTLVGLNNMVHSQGYTSLWRGLGLTMWRDVPFSAIYWLGYESIRNGLIDARQRSSGHITNTKSHEGYHPSFTDSFIAGGVSGTIASIFTQPFDVGKTRKQVSTHSSEKRVSSDLKTPRFLWHIYKTEGISGLFTGWVARTLKVAPACAIMISSYEIGKKMARNMNERREISKEMA
ncbi:MAG: hypothetical protein M1835_004662 [Candelina submexicana]|nr:MAG: hypothetical protein M1835_004662 [Candelina submexicana]